MTRWLYVCSDLGIPLDGTKGASEHVRAITRALAESGAAVGVLAARGRLPEGHPAQQIEQPFGRQVREINERFRGWLSNAGGVPALSGEVSQMLYDVYLSEAIDQRRLEPQADMVVERLSLFCTAGLRLARRLDVPYLVELNAPLADEAARYREAGLDLLARRMEQRTLAAADCVMTVSDELRRHLVDTVGLNPQRVVTIPNGVDLPLFSQPHDRLEARREAGVPADGLVFGFVGSLKTWHGVDTLLEAFGPVRRTLPVAHLLIVGDGRLSDYYRARARELGLQACTTFHGAAPHARIPHLMAAMDVGVAPYLPQDSFYFSPLKLYEYMAAGLCVVASRAGQIAEAIEDGRTGVLFAPGRAGELAAALIQVGRDAAWRSRMGAAARRAVAARGWPRVAARVLELAAQVQDRRAMARRGAAHAA